jgi:hypothetical protein
MPPITQRNLGESTSDYYKRTGYTGDQFGNVDTASTKNLPPPSPGTGVTKTPAIISSTTAIKDVTTNQQKLQAIADQAQRIKDGLASLPPAQTAQQSDLASGKHNPFGYDAKGAAIANPNLGDNAFSADQVAAAGIADPIKEGLLFDAGRGVYYVPNGVTSDKLQMYSDTQSASTAANNNLTTEGDWAMGQMKSVITGADALLADTVNNIMADYQSRKSQLEQSNASTLGSLATTGYRYGTARYVPELNKQLLGVEERAGIQKLADLASQTQGLIAQAKQASASGKFEMLSQYMLEVDKKRTEQAAVAARLAENKAAQDKIINDKLRAASVDSAIGSLLSQGVTDPKQILDFMNYDQSGNMVGDVTSDDVAKAIKNLTADDPNSKNIYDIQKAAWESGAPKEVLAAVGKAKNATEAFQAAGQYLQKATGDLADLQAINAERKAAGKPLIGVEDYLQQVNAKKEKAQAALNAAGLTAALTGTAMGLSDNYEQQSKSFYTVRDSYNRIVASGKDPSAAGDLALIFNYMKMLDPGSTVREGEFANAQNSAGIADVLRAKYNSVVNGERLADVQRNDFVDRSTRLWKTAVDQQKETVQTYSDRAKKFGIDPSLVVRGITATGDTVGGGTDIVQNIDAIKNKVLAYGSAHPEHQAAIKKMMTESDPELGRPLTWAEVQQSLNIP